MYITPISRYHYGAVCVGFVLEILGAGFTGYRVALVMRKKDLEGFQGEIENGRGLRVREFLSGVNTRFSLVMLFDIVV